MTNNYSSEGGHYYYPDGRPAYTVIGKNGKERPTTIRDAKKLGLLPSYSEIMKIYPKPALDTWKVRQGIMAALTIPHLEGEKDEDSIARIFEDSKQQVAIAREKGKKIHRAIELYLQGKDIEPEYEIYAKNAVELLYKHLNINFNICINEYYKNVEHTFACWRDGYGGKIDLWLPEPTCIVDFKTKEFTADTSIKKLAYDENKIQLHSYEHGLGISARLINVFVSTKVPGLIKIVEHKRNNYYLDVFLKLLEFWRVLKKF